MPNSWASPVGTCPYFRMSFYAAGSRRISSAVAAPGERLRNAAKRLQLRMWLRCEWVPARMRQQLPRRRRQNCDIGAVHSPAAGCRLKRNGSSRRVRDDDAYLWGTEVGGSRANCDRCGRPWDRRSRPRRSSSVPGCGDVDVSGSLEAPSLDGTPMSGATFALGAKTKRGKWTTSFASVVPRHEPWGQVIPQQLSLSLRS